MKIKTEKKSKISFFEFVSLMMLITSLTAFSIDIVLPALVVIGQSLVVGHRNETQNIVILIFVGMAVGQIFYGPLSDSIGRKSALSIGIGIFIVGCCICLMATNFEVMLIGRLLQGLGLGAPRVVSVALIRDQYEGNGMARVMSIVMTTFIMAPMIAPAVGQGILMVANWRGIFALLLVMGLIALCWLCLRQSETLPKSCRKAFSVKGIVISMRTIVRDPFTLCYILSSGCISGVFITYLSVSPQMFIRQYGLGEMFPIVFAALALAFGVAAYVNSRFVVRVGLKTMSSYGLLLLIASSIAFNGVAYWFSGNPPLFLLLIYFAIMLFCVGILLGNINTLAMERFREMAGTGAAVVGALSSAVSIFIGVVLGRVYDSNVLPIVTGFLLCALCSMVLMAYAEHYRFRTLTLSRS